MESLRNKSRVLVRRGLDMVRISIGEGIKVEWVINNSLRESLILVW